MSDETPAKRTREEIGPYKHRFHLLPAEREAKQDLLIEYVTAGYPIKAACEEICISYGSHYQWMHNDESYKERFDAAVKSRLPVVEEALFQSALGGEYTEVKETDVIVDGEVRTLTTRTTKLVPANVTAQIFALKNMDPEVWRDRHEIETSHAEPITIVIEQPEDVD